MKKILLIDNYDSFTYNIYHSLSSLKKKVEVFRNDKISIRDVEKKNYDGIVISPGPSHPKNSGICKSIIVNFYKKLPILGICLGHQVIGYAFGALVVRSPEIMHGKLSKIYHDKKNIFKKISNGFLAVRYHSLIIKNKTLPEDFLITAKTSKNFIMAIQHKKYPLFGIQFHPESIKTDYGIKIFKNFLTF